MKISELLQEYASAGTIVSGDFAVVPNPKVAHAKVKRNRYGMPVADQRKNKKGVALGAHEMPDVSLFGGPLTIKR